ALGRVLADPDRSIRLFVLRRMQREKVLAPMGALRRWLREEYQAEAVAALLESLRQHPPDAVRPVLTALVRDRDHTVANRLTALALLVAGLDEASAGPLLKMATTLENGPVLAEVLRQTARRLGLKVSPVLVGKTDSADPLVRAAALEALAELRAAEA